MKAIICHPCCKESNVGCTKTVGVVHKEVRSTLREKALPDAPVVKTQGAEAKAGQRHASSVERPMRNRNGGVGRTMHALE